MTNLTRVSSPSRWVQLGIVAFSAIIIDWFTKYVAFTLVDQATAFVAPITNEELMLLSVKPNRSVQLTVALVLITACLLVHSVALWRARLLPTVVVGAGLGSMAANGIDRLATGVVHDWLVIGPTTWNLADFGVLAFAVVYVTQALRSVA